MNLTERKRYNFIISILFASGFFLFGAMSLMLSFSPYSDGPFQTFPLAVRVILAFIIYGFMGGWLISGVVGGFWLGIRYIRRQSRTFIVLACVLFFITYIVIVYVGLFAAIPFAIYNFIVIRRNKGITEAPEFAESQSSQIAEKNRGRLKAWHILVSVVLFVSLLSIIIYFDSINHNRFFPTMEEAFNNVSDISVGFDHIILIDEHENTVTVIALYNDNFFVSNFITKMYENERWYRYIGMSGYIPLHLPTSSVQVILYHRLRDSGPGRGINRRFREEFGRQPLHGTYRHELVRNLSINGITVEHVFRHVNAQGEQIFLWYFSDFPPVTGPREDIIISFESP